MAKKLEDRSMKRLIKKFPHSFLKFMHINHEFVIPYVKDVNSEEDKGQELDYVIYVDKDSLVDIEFHSTILKMFNLGKYGTYKINLRSESGKYVFQFIVCTGDPDKSLRAFEINPDETVEFDIYFTQEDDADEKIEKLESIINNGEQISEQDEEVMYLTLGLYMSSELPKAELLLKMVELTNKVDGLSDEAIYEINLFQRAFMAKFIPKDHELRGVIENMMSMSDVALVEHLFPDEVHQLVEDGRKSGIEDVALTMKELNIDYDVISYATGLSVDQIEEL